MQQLAEGFKVMHSLNLCHKNAKTSAIFLDKNDNIKIGGFGIHSDIMLMSNNN